MTISVFHMSRDLSYEDRMKITAPFADRASLAKALYEQGRYEHVAIVETTELEDAWIETQNLNSSWSRNTTPGVSVVGRGVVEYQGKEYGYKSSEVGDLFRDDATGRFYVCDMVGFKEL